MYYKLNDYEYKMLKEIEEITLTDYEVGDIIKADNIISALEDLKIAYDELSEEYNDWQEKYEAKGMIDWRRNEHLADLKHEEMMLGELR